jgi:hypothetical protein
MNWTWAPLDQIWRSPAFPMWVTLAAGMFFSLILLITLFRAERSVANGALTVITMLSIGIAVAATVRTFDGVSVDARQPLSASLPALSCLDGLAGDAVEIACEKALFASAEASAAAVSYTAAQISRLTSFGEDVTDGKATSEWSALRRALERDRFGLVAHVLAVRDGCTPVDCSFYKFLSDRTQISANMTNEAYRGLIARYATLWNIPVPSSVVSATPALPPSVPSGKPVSGDFPSSNSIPAVSIMTPEPATPPVPLTPAPKPAIPSTTASTGAPRPLSTPPAVKKPAPKKNIALPGSTPLPLAPPTPNEDN